MVLALMAVAPRAAPLPYQVTVTKTERAREPNKTHWWLGSVLIRVNFSTCSARNKGYQMGSTTGEVTIEQVSHVFRTQLGWIGLAWRGECLFRLTFANRAKQDALQELSGVRQKSELHAWQLGLAERLQRFSEGAKEDFSDVRVDLAHSTAFQQRVYRACRSIPWGSTMTYGALADLAGSPRAARAVGNVMANNRVPLIIPCHRVVATGENCIGGFSAPGGVSTKSKLLALEQAW